MKALDIINKVTLPLKYKLVLTIGSGIVIFSPKDWVQNKLGIQIDGPFRTLFGIIFVLFASLSVAEILIEIGRSSGKLIITKVKQYSENKKIIKNLYELSEEEQDYLYVFLRENTITQNMPTNDGITQSLIRKGIIFLSSRISAYYLNFPHNINPIIWEKIKKHPEILGKAAERYGQKKGRRSIGH